MKATTMRGEALDMGALIAKHSSKVAVGNANMNARGDIIGKGGAITIPREQVAREYHKKNPKAVKQVSLRDIKTEIAAFETPAQAVARQKELNKQQQPKKRKLSDD